MRNFLFVITVFLFFVSGITPAFSNDARSRLSINRTTKTCQSPTINSEYFLISSFDRHSITEHLYLIQVLEKPNSAITFDIVSTYKIFGISPNIRYMRYVSPGGDYCCLALNFEELLERISLYLFKINVFNQKVSTIPIFNFYYYDIALWIGLQFVANAEQYYKTSEKDTFVNLHYIDRDLLYDVFSRQVKIIEKIEKGYNIINRFKRVYLGSWNGSETYRPSIYGYDQEMYCLFNPMTVDNDTKIICNSLSRYAAFLNYNANNYYHNEYFLKDYLAEYLFLVSGKNPEKKKSPDKRNGWNIVILDYSTLFSKKITHSEYLARRDKDEKSIKILVTNYPMYKINSNNNTYQVPHKCLSPSGKKLLFVGSLEQPMTANIYSLDINTKKINTVLKAHDRSGFYNPDLDWTKHGIVITEKHRIYYGTTPGKLHKIKIPSGIAVLKNARLSPSGKYISYFAQRSDGVCLYIHRLSNNSVCGKRIDNYEIGDYQGAWLTKKDTILKNEIDAYQIQADNYWLDRRHKLKTVIEDWERRNRPFLPKKGNFIQKNTHLIL